MRLFRDLKFLYIMTVIVVGIGFGALLNAVSEKTDARVYALASSVIFMGVCFLLVFCLNKVAAKRIQKIHLQRTDHCRIAPYIALYKKWCGLKIPQRQKDLCRMALSTGYIEVGDFDKAKHLLQEVQTTFLDTTEGMFAMACYYNNYAVCLLNEKNAQGAAASLDYMERAIESERLTESERESLQQSYRIKRYLLDMLTGNYDDAMAFFRQLDESETTLPLERVIARYWLGQIYLHDQEEGKAAGYLRFVAENGGDTYSAARARAQLAAMDTDHRNKETAVRDV